MSRFRVHLTAPISGLAAYLGSETIDRIGKAREHLGAVAEKPSQTTISDHSKIQAALQEARLALESARRYGYVEIDGTPADCFRDVAPGWINLDIEATSQKDNDLVTELCTLCSAVAGQQNGHSFTDAYTPSLYLHAVSTRFLVPNRLVASFQEISSGTRS